MCAIAGRLDQRLCAIRLFQEITPLPAFPDVPSTDVVCDADGAVDPVWSRAAAPRVLGVEALELAGGHSPFRLSLPDWRRCCAQSLPMKAEHQRLNQPELAAARFPAPR